MKILIVEDEDSIREVEKAYLEKAGFEVLESNNGQDAIIKFNKNKIDLVVLDLNLPIKNGIEVCKEIRKTSNIPIIMVTARVEEIDEILGLEIGADDYLKKPFSPRILVARVQSLLRRNISEEIIIDDIKINPEKMLVNKNLKKINLTTTQFNILHLLASKPGRVFTREEILDKAYNDSIPKDILDRTVDVHIKAIRKLIEDNTASPKYILTVIGKGYKFNDEI